MFVVKALQDLDITSLDINTMFRAMGAVKVYQHYKLRNELLNPLTASRLCDASSVDSRFWFHLTSFHSLPFKSI